MKNNIVIKTMMVFSFCIMFNTFCDAQNLVPNPSFEDTLECPSFTGYI